MEAKLEEAKKGQGQAALPGDKLVETTESFIDRFKVITFVAVTILLWYFFVLVINCTDFFINRTIIAIAITAPTLFAKVLTLYLLPSLHTVRSISTTAVNGTLTLIFTPPIIIDCCH